MKFLPGLRSPFQAAVSRRLGRHRLQIRLKAERPEGSSLPSQPENISLHKPRRSRVCGGAVFLRHWLKSTRFRSVMKLGTLWSTTTASMPFSAAYAEAGAR